MKSKVLESQVVFVYPPSIVNTIMEKLTAMEFSVFILRDHHKVKAIAQKYPGTIFFLNIDTGLSPLEWDLYIMDLRCEVPEIRLGVLSFYRSMDQELVRYYIMDLGINCGFIHMRQQTSEVIELFYKVLEANEVRGRRKYLRVHIEEDRYTLFKMTLGKRDYAGEILSVSSVGFSCTIRRHPPLVRNQVIPGATIQVQSFLVQSDVVFIGKRKDKRRKDMMVYVFVFKSRTPIRLRSRVLSFISQTLQWQFEHEFRS